MQSRLQARMHSISKVEIPDETSWRKPHGMWGLFGGSPRRLYQWNTDWSSMVQGIRYRAGVGL